MARIGLTITDEMQEKLDAVTKESRIPLSELVRMGIEEILRQHGHTLTEEIVRGGLRQGAGKKARKEKGE